jgi:hypothetical protein
MCSLKVKIITDFKRRRRFWTADADDVISRLLVLATTEESFVQNLKSNENYVLIKFNFKTFQDMNYIQLHGETKIR